MKFCFVMQNDQFRNETRAYWCPGDDYFNDMGTLIFNSQEKIIRQLFHLNGELIHFQKESPANQSSLAITKLLLQEVVCGCHNVKLFTSVMMVLI